MYEYAPQFVKKKEKRLTYGFLGLAAVLFAASMIPGLPLPWVLQLLAVFAIVPMVSIFSLCLSRRYVYTVSAEEGRAPDFVITEYYGRRRAVVCRISVASVKQVLPWERGVREKIGATAPDVQFFSYTGVLFGEGQYALFAEESGVSFLLRICADDGLLRALGAGETV